MKISKHFFTKSWCCQIFFEEIFFWERFDQFSKLKNNFETQTFETFDNFGNSDDVIIL